jgi:transcription initiation factor TFIIB
LWELRHSQDLTLTDCPICNLDLIRDYDKGELVCTKCGFVAEDQKENHGAEWKAFDPEEKEKRTRAGSPRRFHFKTLD